MVEKPSCRISLTLPRADLEEYRELSAMTGLSISRLIRLRLQIRTPIVIVPASISEELQELHGLLEKISKERC